MNTQTAESILAQNTKSYEIIQAHFSQTRHAPWPEFAHFREILSPDLRILDVGCGNGRLFEHLQDQKPTYVGVDTNEFFLDVARKRFADHPLDPQFLTADCRSLPFPDHSFDRVFCLATLYHIPSQNFRQKAMQEISRVLKPGGFFAMLNWNLWQKRFWKDHLRALPNIFLGKLEIGDCWIPWKDAHGVIQTKRFGHAFVRKELRALHQNAGLQLVTSKYIQKTVASSTFHARNILSIGKKN